MSPHHIFEETTASCRAYIFLQFISRFDPSIISSHFLFLLLPLPTRRRNSDPGSPRKLPPLPHYGTRPARLRFYGVRIVKIFLPSPRRLAPNCACPRDESPPQ